MPEGHSIRHFATVHSYGFVGTNVETSSPQGRFTDEAARLNGRMMTGTSAHGKHLFLHFDEDIVHIHLGLYGWFNLRVNKGQEPAESTRLRIANSEYLSDLRAPTTCVLLSSKNDLDVILNRLGPDPIHENADPEKAWQRIHKSSKTIGGMLMNQSIIAGIGNVYRAELLFLSNLSPFTPGKEVPKEKFDEIWANSVRLLRDGSTDGVIRTVEKKHLEAHGVELHGGVHYSYVYKRNGNQCLICKTTVEAAPLEGRTLYWCPTCQM